MMRIAELRDYLIELAEWSEANIYEVPIQLPTVLRDAAQYIEKTANLAPVTEPLTHDVTKVYPMAEGKLKVNARDYVKAMCDDMTYCGDCQYWTAGKDGEVYCHNNFSTRWGCATRASDCCTQGRIIPNDYY